MGSDFNTVLVVYEQTGSGVADLVEVVSNDDVTGPSTSRIQFTTKSNTTYYLMIGSCCSRDQSQVDGGHLELIVENL